MKQDMVIVILPDGSRREVDATARPRTTWRRGSAAGWRGRRLRRRWTGSCAICMRRWSRSDAERAGDGAPRLARGAAADHYEEGSRGARRHAAQRGARDGPGRDAAVRGRAAGVRADHRRPASTTTSTCEQPLSEEDFPAIEAEMQKIVEADERFERLDVPRDEALELCRELGQEFKVEHIETGLADEKTLSFYRQGEFIDLCRGQHIPSTGHIGKAFKLLSRGRRVLEGRRRRASSCSGCTPPRSSTRRSSTPISSSSKRPSAAIIACSASSSSCSPSARPSARA